MPKRIIDPLVRGPIRLRLLEEADLAQTLAWRNQDHIRKWFFYSEVILPEQHRAWFNDYSQREDDFVFVIEQDTLQGYWPVGQISLYHINWETKRGEYGRVMIGEADAAGKGLAREATQAVLSIGFEILGLKEIFLEVISTNVRAIRLYKSVGFQTTEICNNTLGMTIGADDYSAH
jgi:diamine N-acetyltransferase